MSELRPQGQEPAELPRSSPGVRVNCARCHLFIQILSFAIGCRIASQVFADGYRAAAQQFHQETAVHYVPGKNLLPTAPQLVEIGENGSPRVFASGIWSELHQGTWRARTNLSATSEGHFKFAGISNQITAVDIPWQDVRQIVRQGSSIWLGTEAGLFEVIEGHARTVDWPSGRRVYQLALSPEGQPHVGSSGGLYQRTDRGWQLINISDGSGRAWAAQDVLGVAFDTMGRLWFACKAGVGCRMTNGWRFFEGKDGLPWNDFTSIAPATGGGVWFGTRLGAIFFNGHDWHYRQGPRWLIQDEVRQIAVDSQNNAWIATSGGLSCLQRHPMTLAQKAEFFENEIEHYIKRTSYGYVAEASLRSPADKSTAHPGDSDNDGLWTAMYGAGECFAFAATRNPKAKERAKRSFEALRFLQKVAQGGSHSPPKGFVARTVRPIDWPDPNLGRLERDRAAQEHDRLWKFLEPRWPKSADGAWYWKGDTSSDELDGHYYFYPLYFDFCADTPAEKERVREVVRDLTDHLLDHDFVLIDHDGKPTRWAIFGPKHLNHDPNWWLERGLNSLSILSYLSVATHITGDAKYEAAANKLINEHGYAHNAMLSKVQFGPGSGNQSDDEMAFMCFYNLLRYSRLEPLRSLMRYSFFMYWANEAPEMNPFFNFSYAAHSLNATATNAFGQFSIQPWPGWMEDSMATLYGFPLDRLNWQHKNRHRLDVQRLTRQASVDLYEARQGDRGYRVNGKVLPIENRHFNHWNTDPWRLDYEGQGNELASGTVFLLPYYLGLYHGFIEKPQEPVRQ